MPRSNLALRALLCLLLLLGCRAAARAQVTYYEIVARHTGKCLDVSGGSTATGAGLIQWDCVGVSNQQWQVIDVGGGYSKLVARHSGKVADVAGGSLANGATVWQMDENGTGAQQWQITAVGGGYSKILARHSGKALDVSGGSTANGAVVHQWDYVGIANQQWLLRPVPPGAFTHFELSALHSGKCLDADATSTANGARVQQFDCNNTAAQKWQVSAVGGGYYQLIARNSGKCLDVAGGSTANGAVLHQWDCVGVLNQHWQLIDLGSGVYKLLARHSGRALDVPNESTANGVQVIQWDYVAATNQQWRLRGVALNRAPATPAITEPSSAGQIVSPFDVHMETGPFSDPDAGSVHVCSDWEILKAATAERVWAASCKTGTGRVHVHFGDGAFLGSYAGRTSLEAQTDFRLRVRHKDASGDPVTQWSAWAERPFRTSPPPPPGGAQMWTPQTGYVVELVATGFQLPVNIAFVPNPGTAPTSPFYYVTELYGTIKVVTRNGTVSDYAANLLNFAPNGQFPGSGELGLTGIVVDPATGDVYASMLYQAANGELYPKVTRFQSSNGGLSAATQTTILNMVGEPQGASHQVSNLSIGPDGKLYVHVGDGFAADTALNLNSFRGKILRVNLNGSAPPDNPFYNAADGIGARDYVYAYGFRNPFGGAWRAADNQHYEVENGPGHYDRFAKVTQGASYGWNGTEQSMTTNAIYNWFNPVAPVNMVFVQPQTFGGAKQGSALVTQSGPTYAPGPTGKRITEFVLNAAGGLVSGPTTLVEYTGTGVATVVGLAAGPDGLYFTDLYKDNGASPTERGANVWRVRKH